MAQIISLLILAVLPPVGKGYCYIQTVLFKLHLQLHCCILNVSSCIWNLDLWPCSPPPITGGLLSREMRATAAAMRLRVPSPHQVLQNFLTKSYANLISTHRWSRANRIHCLRAGTMVEGLPRACRSTKVLTKGYPDLTVNNKLCSIEGVIWPKSSWS